MCLLLIFLMTKLSCRVQIWIPSCPLSPHSMYVCVYTVWLRVCTYVLCTWRQNVILWCQCHTPFWAGDRIYHRDRGLLITLGRLPSKPLGPSSFCLHGTEIISVHPQAQIFTWVQRTRGPHAFMAITVATEPLPPIEPPPPSLAVTLNLLVFSIF